MVRMYKFEGNYDVIYRFTLIFFCFIIHAIKNPNIANSAKAIEMYLQFVATFKFTLLANSERVMPSVSQIVSIGFFGLTKTLCVVLV